MAQLEQLTPGVVIKGILPDRTVSVIDMKWYGNSVAELIYKDPVGNLGHELLYRDRESSLEIVTNGAPWRFDGDGALFRLCAEAYRIRMAHLFDPRLAVHTSTIDPLPHQITAVYEEMLQRQPLRFLLADDPGAGKTIMTGLLIKELLVRGDVQRCLIVCPGSLVEQWQDELDQKFQLPFDILTNDKLEAARTGNWFLEHPLAICRLDKLSRNEDVQTKLKQVDWDLIVCDEAHKMSASYFGNAVKYTKRYHLGQLLSKITRHFLLLTATPHNGKEADFQLFMALLDEDRFEGKLREAQPVTNASDASDLMRRMVKEDLVKFDGTPLFPERVAYTVTYPLTDAEAQLYQDVSDYVRDEFNRADQLDDKRKGTVGFALTTLQRRLASSPAAIAESLCRRRERLEKRLREEKQQRHTGLNMLLTDSGVTLSAEDIDDLDDAPGDEVETIEQQVVDQASAARTIAELEAELTSLRRLEKLALKVKQSGHDCKWDELSGLLQGDGEKAYEMFDAQGHRRKLVIFTEHRDTLNYLRERIVGLLGKEDAVVTIHGGMGRDARFKAQYDFTQDPRVQVLVATDAAGEGINLQRAHLMVNYDLPWNPNRLEQRFGRIHRIGQKEVCHLWNMLASQTREGDVYQTLLHKIELERAALGGRVFNVLGKLLFDEKSLKDLLIEAIRYGDQPEKRAELHRIVDAALDRDKLYALLEDHALSHNTLSMARVRSIRDDMNRFEARRLQPHFIASFFIEAFRLLGGSLREREAKRYEISYVPAAIRNRDRSVGRGNIVRARYERITFERNLRAPEGKPLADFVCPGHPLLEAVIDLMRERTQDLLKRGAVLVDPNDFGDAPRALVFIEHSIQDASADPNGNRRVIAREMQFVELDAKQTPRHAGYAPYLDYRPLQEGEEEIAKNLLGQLGWLHPDLEETAKMYAITKLVPEHLSSVRARREYLADKTLHAVRDRLSREIRYWDNHANELKQQELAGKTPRINSGNARQRADELERRLRKREEELALEKKISASPPLVLGGALVLPVGLLNALRQPAAPAPEAFTADALARRRVELAAMIAIMQTERNLGHEPRDVSAEKCGYDIESRLPQSGDLRFIEVKGRAPDAATITITKNEILTGLNKPNEYVLAIVEVSDTRDTRDDAVTSHRVHYVRQPFKKEPDFGVTSVNYDLRELLALATEPS